MKTLEPLVRGGSFTSLVCKSSSTTLAGISALPRVSSAYGSSPEPVVLIIFLAVTGESPATEKQLYHKYRAARCEAVQKFIQFRSEGIQDRAAWAKIISPKFILTQVCSDRAMPITGQTLTVLLLQPILPFRAYADCERQGELYCCRGIDGLIADTALLKTVMTRLASSRAKRANCSCSVKVVYVVDPGEMLVALVSPSPDLFSTSH